MMNINHKYIKIIYLQDSDIDKVKENKKDRK